MPRHAILQIRFGPQHGTKVVLAPRTLVRVGRTERADVVLAHDPTVSGIHAEVAWDGRQAYFKDLDTPAGTLLDGVRTPGGRVPHGSWLQIGQTALCLYHEDHTPRRREPTAEPQRVAARRAALARLRDVPSLFAILDAARDERIRVLLRESIDEARSLYQGPKGDALWEVAPHLVRFHSDSRLLDRVVEEGWGEAWGITFSSSESPRELRRHLRRFLMVEREESGEPLYFRYYDPRVWRTFLPMATVLQRSELFGPIDRFFAEGPQGELVCYERDGAR
jgi:pSer/pThr/pTyr-binding forkhead associated (FHA) protein